MTNKCKILYIGSFSSAKLLSKTILSKNLAADFATNNYQYGFLKTINTPYRELTITSLPFARRRKLNFSEVFISNFSRTKFMGIQTYFLPNITIPILRNIWEFLILFMFLWIKKGSSFDYIVIFSASFSINLSVTLYSKIKGVKGRIICIVDDLPEYTSTSNKRIIKKFKDFYTKNFKKLEIFYFGFIFLSPGMKDKYVSDKSKYIIMEGIYDNSDNYNFSDTKTNIANISGLSAKNQKYIMYAGSLEKKHGIISLIEGFVKYKEYYDDKELYLLISGFSNDENVLKSTYKNNKNIIFLSSLEKSDINMLMRSAIGLFIPTPPDQEFTKYFFPSKLIEYMSSGTITALTKLKCVPEEYFKYTITIAKSDKHGIFKTIELIINMDESKRLLIGKRAKKFIINEKSWKSWSPKLDNWLCQK